MRPRTISNIRFHPREKVIHLLRRPPHSPRQRPHRDRLQPADQLLPTQHPNLLHPLVPRPRAERELEFAFDDVGVAARAEERGELRCDIEVEAEDGGGFGEDGE
jgi:hypothetical protein